MRIINYLWPIGIFAIALLGGCSQKPQDEQLYTAICDSQGHVVLVTEN